MHRLPPPPTVSRPPARIPFPLVAVIAPIIGAAAIGIVTGSAYVWVFALLSPLIAIATTLDGRRVARRERRAEAQRFERECAAFDQAITRAHAIETAEAAARYPNAVATDLAAVDPIRLGSAPRRSAVAPDDVLVAGESAEENVVRALLARARVNPSMPVLVPRGRVVLMGEGVVTDALERRLAREPGVEVVRAGVGEHPGHDAVTVRVITATRLEVRVPGRQPVEARPEFVSRVVVDSVRAPGVAVSITQPLSAVPWSAVAGVAPSGDSLTDAPPSALAFGHDGKAVAMLDLEREGPHALVGGTTGSGKSEFLRTLALAWAARRSPAELHLLFIDFKGGATFAGLTELPHAVGLVTDLDPLVAERAVQSLRAELRRRERVLVDAGVRDLAQSPDLLARLVVLVDEFAALLESFPDLQAVFADISARGRSLGVHLVLCTQHPAAAVRDAVAANCGVRIAFRMSESAGASFIGPPGRELASVPPGRAVVVTGEETRLVQVATIDEGDLELVRHRWATVAPASTPWKPPLPATLEWRDLPALEPTESSDGMLPPVPFGLLDDPLHQRQPLALWDPQRDGALAVVGAPRSGRSTALAAVARAARARGASVVVLPSSVVEAWAVLERVAEHPDDGLLLVADDLDHLVAISGDLAPDLLVRWDAAARAVRRGGGGVAASIGSASTARSALSGRFESRLVLRCRDGDDHTLAGAPRGLFDRSAPAGRGWWADRQVQVVHTDCRELVPEEAPAEPWTVPSDHDTIVIARRVDAVAASLRHAHPEHSLVLDLAAESIWGQPAAQAVTVTPRIYLADPEGWQAAWSLFSSLRRTAPVVVSVADAADVRAVLGVRSVPPPIDPRNGDVWVMEPGGALQRRRAAYMTAG